MPAHADYITAVREICGQANSAPYDLMLAASTPRLELDDRLRLSFGVGGIVTMLIDSELYAELKGELRPLMRVFLRNAPFGDTNLRKIEFYPATTVK